MRYLVLALLLASACDSRPVFPLDDEDAGDGGTEASTPPADAATDTSTNDAGVDG